MPVNLELKAKIVRPEKTLRLLESLGRPSEILVQTDTYFQVEVGRLKLREFGNGKSELIYYIRKESKGRRWSKYDMLRIPDPAETKGFLKKALGIDVVVRKSRLVYYYKKQARIHLDRVKGLGVYLEFEVYSTRNPQQAFRIYKELVNLFEIGTENIIQCSYADLIRKNLRSAKVK